MKVFLLLLFWSLWYVNFCTRTILSPLLPILEDELALTHALAGSIFLFVSMGYTLTSILSGLLSPRVGYKRFILFGFGILMVSQWVLRYAETYRFLAVASLLIGLGAGMYLPSAIPLLTGIFGRQNWGKAIALHDTAASFSILSVPLLTVLGLHFFHWRTLFIILSASCVGVSLLFWALIPNPLLERKPRIHFSLLLGRKDFWIMVLLWIFAVSNGIGLYNVIPLFLVKENGVPLETANMFLGFSRIGGLIVAILSGFYVDRYGFRMVLSLLLLLTGLSTAGLALSHALPVLVAMLIVQGTVCTGLFPVAQVAISRVTDVEERSIYTGASIAFGMVVGLGLTPFLLGAVADVWSFRIGIFMLGVLTVLCCGLTRSI